MTISEESRDDPSAGKSGSSPSAPGTGVKSDTVHLDPATRPHAAELDAPDPLPQIIGANLHQQTRGSASGERHLKIAQRAYELAERRGFAPGVDFDDWLRAEKEINAESDQGTPMR